MKSSPSPAALAARPLPSRRTVRLGSALAAVLVATGASCAGPQQEETRVVASASVEAQRELRAIEEEWAISSPIKRQAQRPRLERFVERYQTDPSVLEARVLLARIAVSEGRLGAAEEILQPALRSRAGPVVDQATLVLAQVRNRQGRPDDALDLLRPLEGKLLREEARFEYSEERARAALSARRWRLAVDTMTTWIAQAERTGKEARDWVQKALVAVPAPALSRMLAEWDEAPVSQGEAEARSFIQRLIISQLSQQALARKDTHLARDLLAHAPPWLRASDVGDELSLLAALAVAEARVSGRVLGVVLGGGDATTRHRSVQAGVGLMHGLGLGVGRKETRGVGLIVEENRGSIRAALASLSAQGAAILVASGDAAAATEVLSFAETRRVPVVVLAPPVGLERVDLEYGFSFGVTDAEQMAAMKTAFAEARLAFVGASELPCPSSKVRPTTTSLPLQEWAAEGVSVLGILGDATCARQVIRDTFQSQSRFEYVLGLEAGTGPLGPLPAGSTLSYLTAARYPETRLEVPSDHYVPGEGFESARVTGWYEQLGLDLARLLGVALLDLPETRTSDPEQVRRLHDRARDALLSAEANLVTTQARGFQGGHVIRRELGVVTRDTASGASSR